MIDLAQRSEPYEIALPYGLTVTVKPLTTERGKKRIRALCRWQFQPGGEPEYCRACRDDGLPCARGEPGADGRLCPTARTP